MGTRLRTLAPIPARIVTTPLRGTTGLFWCGVFAIVFEFGFSSKALFAMGYTINIHPAAVFIAMCAIYAVVRGIIPLGQLTRRAPALMLFIVGIPLVMLYSMYFVGFSGSTVFLQSFWSAGLLALILEPASARQKRLLGGILIAAVIANVVLGLYESYTQAELFPVSFDPDDTDFLVDGIEDFRAHALYDHPLTASLHTAMAIFLLYSSRIRLIFAAPMFGLMRVGLLAFGGRTALGVTMVVSAAAAVFLLVKGLVIRRPNWDLMVAIALAVIIIPPLTAVIVSETTIADRIVHTLYYDDSAGVRATQWNVFGYLTLQDWLFGISKLHLDDLKFQIGLGGKYTDIENFWILIFLDLGAPGFLAFLSLFGACLLHLVRYANTLSAWLQVVSANVYDTYSK